MDALPPSLPNAGPPQPVPAGQAGLAILLAELSNSLAQALAKLPANTPLTALVTQILPSPVSADPGVATQPAGLLVQVSTPDGPAQIRLPPQISVTPGAKLDIVIAPAGPGPQPQARLLTVNDRPVTPAMTGTPQSVSAPAPTIAAPSAATVQMAPKPPPTPGIPATLVTSSDPALPAGTTLLVRITGLTPPQASEPVPEQDPSPQIAGEEPSPPPSAAPVQTPGLPPASTPAAAVIAEPGPGTSSVGSTPEPVAGPPQPAPPPAALAPQPATAPLAPTLTPTDPGTPISVPAASPIPMPAASPIPMPAPAAPVPAPTSASASDPAAPISAAPMPQASPPPIGTAPAPAPSVQSPAPAPAPAPAPTEISGQVLPNTDAGKPLVRTPIGLLALDTGPQTLPPDTTVTLQLVGKPVPPPAFTPALPLPDDSPDRVLPKRLTQLVETAQNSPGGDALADAVREKIPAPGPKLAAQLLSAMASSDQPQGLTRFLGDGLAAALIHAAPQAIEALSRHWEAASTPVQGPAEGDWRSLMLPFLMGGEITNLRLTVRQRQGKMAAAEREKGTRFLLDLDLSRLGPMQFDGLVKRQHKRFDLIIRTSTALSGEMRRDIDALFINGLLNFGLEGTVAFQPEGRFVVTPRLTGDANGMIFA